MKLLFSIIISVSVVLCITGCSEKENDSTPTIQESNDTSSSKPHRQYSVSDVEDMTEADLLLAIKEFGFDDKGVLIFTEKLKDIAPEMNMELGSALKQDYTFDWYVSLMLSLKVSEQQFKALDMIDIADEVGAAVESLELGWSQSDLHEILNISFYVEDVNSTLEAIEENMTEEQQQQLTVDFVPVKELAKRLLEQAETENKPRDEQKQ